jgi:small conductance mechanosensitive channel
VLDGIIDFWNNNHPVIFKISGNVLASVILLVISLLISKGLTGLVKKACNSKLHIDSTFGTILIYVIKYGIIIVCLIMILNIFGVNTASLIALLGAAGLAIGLALKDTLGNIAAGIILFFLGSYRIGEFIEFASFSGTVKEISLFTTILETPDGIYISAPNSSIWGNPLKNYTRNGKRRMELSVKISYSDSLEKAFNALNNIIETEPKFLKDPAPQIIVQSYQDSNLSLAIRAWTNINDYWDIYWKHMRNIREKIEEAGLKIPLPQHEINIKQEALTAKPLQIA